MNPIQSDLTDHALVTAIRLNLCEFYRHLSRSFSEGHLETDRFARWQVPVQHPWFNGVLSSHTPQEGDEGFVEETIQYFRSKRVGTCTWWMEPHLHRSDWEPLLSKYGFRFSHDTPGMAADLQSLNESLPAVDGLEIRAVTHEEEARTWAHVFRLGYGLPPDWEPAVYNLATKLGLDFPIHNYIGYLDDEPVATSCLFLGAGVAGMYSVSTLPKARGKGIGALITQKPLLNARELGYRIGVLQSSEMGFNVYKKLGFRHLCQIEYFYLGLH